MGRLEIAKEVQTCGQSKAQNGFVLYLYSYTKWLYVHWKF